MTSAGETTTDAFPIAWQEPDDAELMWEWDDMHMPTAVTPLAGDYNILMGSGFAYGYERLSVPYEVLTRVWNSYTYFAWRMHVPRIRTRSRRGPLHAGPPRGDPDERRVLGARRRRALRDLRLGGGPPGRDGRCGRRRRGLGRGVATDRAAPGRSTSTRSAARTR